MHMWQEVSSSICCFIRDLLSSASFAESIALSACNGAEILVRSSLVCHYVCTGLCGPTMMERVTVSGYGVGTRVAFVSRTDSGFNRLM